jgi:hypothetical protein
MSGRRTNAGSFRTKGNRIKTRSPSNFMQDSAASPLSNQHSSNVQSRRRTREWETTHVDPHRIHSHLPVTPDSRGAEGFERFLPFEINDEAGSLTDRSAFSIITQSSDNEMEDDQILMPIERNQRKKPRTDNHNFQPTFDASHSTASTIEMVRTHISMDASANANVGVSSVHTKTRPQCWWKIQNSNSSDTNHSPSFPISKIDPSCKCHVCQAPAPSQTHAEIMQLDGTQTAFLHETHRTNKSLPKQKNSLLSYFNPTKQVRQSTSQSVDSQRTFKAQAISSNLTLPLCAYCDRPACVSCMRSCEGGCSEVYCTFCSRIDYEGIQERVFCFGCHDGDVDSSCGMDTS